MSSGFLEGIVRGYKAGLLTQGAYHNLTQCENLEGECFDLNPPFISSSPRRLVVSVNRGAFDWRLLRCCFDIGRQCGLVSPG